MKCRFTIWHLLIAMLVVAFVTFTWTSRIEHRKIVSKLQSTEAQLTETEEQLEKTEYGLLLAMRESIAEDPQPFSNHGIAKDVAQKLALKRPNNNYIWWVLVQTGALQNGTTLAEAEAILGPASDKTNPRFVYWYDETLKDPEKLRASRNLDKLQHWVIGRDSNFLDSQDGSH